MYFVDETPLLESASKRQKDRESGQVSMFDLFGDDPDSGFEEEVPEPDGVEWPKRQLLTFEKEIMKIYVSDHPLRPYEGTIARMTKFSLGDLAERTKEIKSAVFVGMISNVVTKLTKRGTKMATFTLEDTTGHVECICFKYDDNAEAIQEDAIVKVKGKFEANDRGNQIMAFEVEVIELNEADARPSHLELKVASSDFDQSKSLRLNRILKSYPGRDGVVLLVQQSDGRKFRAELPVSVDSRSPVMRSEIQDLFGSQVWRASLMLRRSANDGAPRTLRSAGAPYLAAMPMARVRSVVSRIAQSLKQSCSLEGPAGAFGSCGTRLVGNARYDGASRRF